MICDNKRRLTRIVRISDLFDFINYSADKLIILLLVMVRASGLFVLAPVLGDKAVPKLIKVGMVVLFGLILSATIPNPQNFQTIKSNWQLVSLIFNEILIGVIIGLMFRLIFYGVLTAGSIVGYQIGFMFAQEFDPSNSTQVSIIGRFWYLLAILLFVSINGHHLVIKGLADSFTVIPPGNFNAYGSAGEMIIKYSAYIFIIAFKIASPIIITLYLTDVALGTIAKTIPTMNVFFVGFPIKIFAGLTVMAMSLPLFMYVLEKSLSYFNTELSNLLFAIGKA